jgi:hypothetical protein
VLRSAVSRNAAILVVIALASLAVNFATLTRSPTIAEDEVAFTEPALNLATGHGFSFPGWNDGRLWTGNAPLYPLLLSGWLRIVPFSIAGVRSLNVLIALAAFLLVIAAAMRSGIVTEPALLFAALLCSYSISFSYRSGRYDALCMLLFAIALLGATFTGWRRYALLAVGAFFMPGAGLLLPACAAVASLILLIAYRRTVIRDLFVFWIAMLTGVAALLLLYAHNGILQDFLTLIGRHSVVHGANVETTSFNSLAHKWRRLPFALWSDKVNLLLIVVVAAVGRRRRPRLVWTVVAIAVVLPLAVELLYMYRIYYGWMTAIPLLIVLASFRGSRCATIALVVVIAAGLPARILLTAVEWRSRNYAPVEALAARNIRPADSVYADFAAYYAVRSRTRNLWLPLQRFPPYVFHPPAATLLIIGGESAEDVKYFAGEWVEVDRYTAVPAFRRSFGAAPYDLHVYRRRV